MDLDIRISPPAFWPMVSLHDINTTDAPVNGDFFVGYGASSRMTFHTGS